MDTEMGDQEKQDAIKRYTEKCDMLERRIDSEKRELDEAYKRIRILQAAESGNRAALQFDPNHQYTGSGGKQSPTIKRIRATFDEAHSEMEADKEELRKTRLILGEMLASLKTETSPAENPALAEEPAPAKEPAPAPAEEPAPAPAKEPAPASAEEEARRREYMESRIMEERNAGMSIARLAPPSMGGGKKSRRKKSRKSKRRKRHSKKKKTYKRRR